MAEKRMASLNLDFPKKEFRRACFERDSFDNYCLRVMVPEPKMF